ncbi:hypothetical protein TVAG_166680 [Trichomonas vaginalis G3]|uniref:Uncharacterized protein n=1 Tax=Trichomonas vaginalis (strain ATCC PRA-98 / G3) TaxID=412133 RepID=A2DE75_TRIV3|nr:armadillo (ARM) repeat-containing protein family [Trichomonas vaginalis G3]EAY21293.1 hypothetical protein TVAG_166680 [Trichomonas vaginalis G3]KAI5548867.1 armadillo (ARM) repeat-containing protein family [Trichomonas vaginalis G3]|eukprot:XP_001582279.1 hypothetical protein [Trichomonas vaginalis G3]
MEYKLDFDDPMLGIPVNMIKKTDAFDDIEEPSEQSIQLPDLINDFYDKLNQSNYTGMSFCLHNIEAKIKLFIDEDFQVLIESNFLLKISQLLFDENYIWKEFILQIFYKLILKPNIPILDYLINEIEIYDRLFALIAPENEKLHSKLLTILYLFLEANHNLAIRYVRCLNPDILHTLLLSNIPSNYNPLYEATNLLDSIFEYIPHPEETNEEECAEFREFMLGIYDIARNLILDVYDDMFVSGCIIVSSMLIACPQYWSDVLVSDEDVNNAIIMNFQSNFCYVKQKAMGVVYCTIKVGLQNQIPPFDYLIDLLAWPANNSQEKDLSISKTNIVSFLAAKLLELMIQKEILTPSDIIREDFLNCIENNFNDQPINSKVVYVSLITLYILYTDPPDHFARIINSELKVILFDYISSSSPELILQILHAFNKMMKASECIQGNAFINSLTDDDMDELSSLLDSQNEEIAQNAEILLNEIESKISQDN